MSENKLITNIVDDAALDQLKELKAQLTETYNLPITKSQKLRCLELALSSFSHQTFGPSQSPTEDEIIKRAKAFCDFISS